MVEVNEKNNEIMIESFYATKLMEMEDKLSEVVKNQTELRDTLMIQGDKIDQVINALIGNALTDNKGMVHDLSSIRDRVTKVEKFVTSIKSGWIAAGVILTGLGFVAKMIWDYFLLQLKK